MAWLRFPAGTPVVVDEHNIESELLGRMGSTETSLVRRGYNRWEYRRYRDYERKVWHGADACATTSRRDADAVLAQSSGLPVLVVPNGVDPAEFQPSGEAGKSGSIVFTGLLEYRPNEDGIRWFLNAVYPLVLKARPDAHVTVVGGGPAELLDSLRAPGVTVTGRVPDVRPFMDAAAVAVVPLRMGGGTRLKVVEAMSMSKAIVSTSLGAEGLDVVSGTHLELADDPADFAESVVALLDDPARGALLGVAARRLVEDEYTWAQAARRLEELHRQVVALRAGAAGGAATRPLEAPEADPAS
jgi:polysaccharide biosynthesis protein PslH